MKYCSPSYGISGRCSVLGAIQTRHYIKPSLSRQHKPERNSSILRLQNQTIWDRSSWLGFSRLSNTSEAKNDQSVVLVERDVRRASHPGWTSLEILLWSLGREINISRTTWSEQVLNRRPSLHSKGASNAAELASPTLICRWNKFLGPPKRFSYKAWGVVRRDPTCQR